MFENSNATNRHHAVEGVTYLVDRVCGSAKLLVQGLGLHPGAVTGYLFTQPENVLRVRTHFADFGEVKRLPIIFGVDAGNCSDLEALSYARGFVSSNASPNAWCAVQAKCEGVSSVIGLHGSFQGPELIATERKIDIELVDGVAVSTTILARRIEIKNTAGELIRLREGDVITIDGATGKVFAGKVDVSVPVVKELHFLMVDLMKESINRFGPVEGWRMYKDTKTYRRYKTRLVALVGDMEFADYTKDMQLARRCAPLRVMATVHTMEGTLQARIAFADIVIDAGGDIVVTPNDADTGIGLLRTERIFRNTDDLDALRVLILGEEVVSKTEYEYAQRAVIQHQTARLSDIFAANSGCSTVVRTLCMPFNKLFQDDLNTAALFSQYQIDADQADALIRVSSLPRWPRQHRLMKECYEQSTFCGSLAGLGRSIGSCRFTPDR